MLAANPPAVIRIEFESEASSHLRAMKPKITEARGLQEKFQELQILIPDQVTILPSNFVEIDSKQDALFEGTAVTLNKVLNSKGVDSSLLNLGDYPSAERIRKTIDWIGPTLFFTASVLSENPHLLSLSLGVISNYLTDFFRGVAGIKKASLEIIVETEEGGEFVSIKYEGDPTGLDSLCEIIAKARNGN